MTIPFVVLVVVFFVQNVIVFFLKSKITININLNIGDPFDDDGDDGDDEELDAPPIERDPPKTDNTYRAN